MRLSKLVLCLLLIRTLPVMAGWRILTATGNAKVIRTGTLSIPQSPPIFTSGSTTPARLPFTIIPPIRGTQLRIGDTVITPDSGRVLLQQEQQRYLLFPGSRMQVTSKGPTLKEGTVLRGNRSLSRHHTSPITLSATPEHPLRGMTCTLQLSSSHLADRPRLILDRKWRSPFYRIGKTGRYRARFGVDCREWRREQPFRIRCRLKNGFILEIRHSILLNRWKSRGRDILNEYSWSSLPSVRRDAGGKTPNHSFFTAGRFKFFKKKQPVKTRKKDSPPPRPFRPTIRLSAAKRRLYWKRQKIRKEAKIHRRALSGSSNRQLWRGNFIYPGPHFFTSIFGEVRFWSRHSAWAHRGIDIASPMGYPVVAPNNGIIRFSGDTVLCGKNIIIDHGQYLFSKIFHLSKLLVRNGQQVKKGQLIGLCGSTGISTGPHIHWEMWVGSTKIDPNSWILGKTSRELPAPVMNDNGERLFRFLSPLR